MFHVILTLLIYGVDTKTSKCPETCTCIENVVTYDSNNYSAINFDARNSSKSTSEHMNEYDSILNSVAMNEPEYSSDIVGDNQKFSTNYTQTKKCAKNVKENIRDIFIHNIPTKLNENFGVNNPKEIRIKRTLKRNFNSSTNANSTTHMNNESQKNFTVTEKRLMKVGSQKDSENSRNKELFTYQITCNEVRDLKPLWIQHLPNPTIKLNIRETFFESFKAFQQILRESPTKLNQLTVLSISNSVIHQKMDKKYSLKAESSTKERNPLEKKNENKHSEFLPFASLQNPQLRSKPELDFTWKGKCKNLQVINLANNTITDLPEDTFHPFENLKILNLSNNLLKFIPNEMFNSLINLLQLDIHNNRLQSLNEVMFKNLTKLLFLDVSQNMISNIAPSTFQYLINLNIINLASNPLSEKQEAMILLGTGKRLKIVDISKTGLKQIPGTLERSVRILNLMGNHLLSIRCGDLDSYSLLSYLNLRANKISYIEDDALGRLDFLNNLQISENNLFQIPKSLPNNLEILNLSYNNIQNITNSDFLNLSLLKELFISYNQVSSIEGKAFNNLIHLKVLDLSRNPILILPNLYGLVKLTVLNLSYFTNIPQSYSNKYKQFPVQSCENIKHLILESSPVLTKVFLQDTKTLQSFINLEKLDLRFTNLTTIRKDIFNLLPKLKILKAEGNPWHCGKEILTLSDWLKNHESNETLEEEEDEINTAHCSTPEHLHKIALVKLSDSDFSDEIVKTNGWEVLNEKSKKETGSTNISKKYSEKMKWNKLLSNEQYVNLTNITDNEIISKETSMVKTINTTSFNDSSANVLSFLNDNKTKNEGKKNCCGKSKERLESWSSQNNSTVEHLLPSTRSKLKENSNLRSIKNSSSIYSISPWYNNSNNFETEMKNLVELKTTQESFKTVKKPEAVTAKDSLSLKKEFNSHLSFLILSSVGLIVVATLAFTSVYFSKTRRVQSYQRQVQDIEVCSISSLGNELW